MLVKMPSSKSGPHHQSGHTVAYILVDQNEKYSKKRFLKDILYKDGIFIPSVMTTYYLVLCYMHETNTRSLKSA